MDAKSAEPGLSLDDSEVMIGAGSIVAAQPPEPDPGPRFQLMLEEGVEAPTTPERRMEVPKVSVGGLEIEDGVAHVSVVQVEPEDEEEDSQEDSGER